MFYKVLDSFRIGLFVQNDWYRTNSFFIWLLSFPSTICWKSCWKVAFFSNVCFDTFVKNDMIIGKWVSFCILYSIPFVCQFFSLLYPLCYFGSAVSYDISHYDIRLPDFWEAKGVPVSWLCEPCTYGVPDPSGSFNLSSSSSTETFQDPRSIWIWNTASAAISCWINFLCSLWWWFC